MGRRRSRVYKAQAAAPVPAPTVVPDAPGGMRTQRVKLQTTDFPSLLTAADVTPATIVSALASGNVGEIGYLADLVDSMLERDGHMAGVVRSRRLAIVGKSWELREPQMLRGAVAGYDTNAIMDSCRMMLEAIPNFQDRILHLTSSLTHPLAALGNIWDVSMDSAWIADLQPMHAKKFYQNTTDTSLPMGEWRFRPTSADRTGEPLTWGNWTINADPGLASWPFRAGLGRLLCWLYLFKIYPLKDWVTYTELCGMDLVYAQVDKRNNDEEWAAVKATLSTLGTEATAIVSPQTELKSLSRNSHDGLVYEKVVNLVNAEMSKAVLGQTLTTEIGSTGGAYAAARVHGDVRQDLLEADARSLERALRDGILVPFVRFNYGDDAPVPYIHFNVEFPDDLQARAKVDEILVRMGWDPPLRYLVDKYSRPIAGADEPTLRHPERAPGVEPVDATGTAPGSEPTVDETTETPGIPGLGA